ncbi:355_t:CDS:2 [Funneliformis caledonium]|uniref:355_t:CDS:1 n=1 Tax=Funneliformis caledonium TaxID=1117310 RepID=A0A9N8WNK5_9GLOM|nr:355_t:CDS:2 [Funneliformis caledonium]
MKVKDFYELSIPLILDGGMASELQATHGKELSTNLWSAACLYQDPNAIREVHLSYFRAGADIAITCSYQAHLPYFTKVGFTKQEATELMQKSIQLAIEARDVFWEEYQSKGSNVENDRIKPMIALSLGPFGAILTNGSEYRGDYGSDISLEKLIEFHKERLNIFKPLFSQIDLISFETIPLYLEAESICSLLRQEQLDVPCLITFSCKNDEEISHGESFADCVKLCSRVHSVVGVGVNCTKPKFIEKLVKIARDVLDESGMHKKYVVCYPDGGAEWDYERKDWNNDEMEPEEFGNRAKIWAELANFKILLGGCCKTTPDHIRCIRQRIL